MESKLANAIGLELSPVAIFFGGQPHGHYAHFEKGRHGCVINMLYMAAKGIPAVMERQNFGCSGIGACGGRVITAGDSGFTSALNSSAIDSDEYAKTVFLGASSSSTPVPFDKIPQQFVVFKPFSLLNIDREPPRLVGFLANPDQLAALIMLATYECSPDYQPVLSCSPSCRSIVLEPYEEARREESRPVVGNLELLLRHRVPAEMLSFTVSFKKYASMEKALSASGVEKLSWDLMSRRSDAKRKKK